MIQSEKIKELTKEESFTFIILDACRYDKFSELHQLNGNLEKTHGTVSNTWAWIENYKKYFEGSYLITAHPIWRGRTDIFSGFNHVWEPDENINELNVVEPETIVKELIDCEKDKILTHIVQPHLPFISDEGKKIMKKLSKEKGFFQGANFTVNLNQEILKDNYSWEKLESLYEKNLETLLNILKKYENEIPNDNIVISADHAELLGEQNHYGHNYPSHPKQFEIPWFELGKKQNTSSDHQG